MGQFCKHMHYRNFLNVSNYDAEVIDYRCEHMENFL